MNGGTHRIRRSFIIPFTVVLILVIGLWVFAFFCRGTSTERVFLTIVLILLALAWVEAISRQVILRNEGITIRKFMRNKVLLWEDITHVGCLIMRKKVYLLLTTVKGFLIVSNEYERFQYLAGGLVGHLDGGKIEIEAEVRQQAEHPLTNRSNVVAAWVAAVVLTIILFLKLFPV